MKRSLWTSALVLVCSASIASAAGDPDSSSLSRSDSDCNKARKAGRVCKLVFDDHVVDGDRPDSQGEQVTARASIEFSSLISVRSSFRDLIIKSAESL